MNQVEACRDYPLSFSPSVNPPSFCLISENTGGELFCDLCMRKRLRAAGGSARSVWKKRVLSQWRGKGGLHVRPDLPFQTKGPTARVSSVKKGLSKQGQLIHQYFRIIRR